MPCRSFAVAVLIFAQVTVAHSENRDSSGSGSTSESSQTNADPQDLPFDIDFTVVGASDYRFRGVSQTGRDPALQGTVKATAGQFYAGTFVSNVDFGTPDPDLEIDLMAGFTPKLGGITFDTGVIYYVYPSEASDSDFVELKAGLSYDFDNGVKLGGTYYFAPDYFQSGAQSHYTEGTLSAPLYFDGLTFGGSLGYYAFSDHYASDYLTWKAGATYQFTDEVSFNVSYIDTDLGNDPFCAGTFACGATLFGSVSVSTSLTSLRDRILR